MNKLKHIVLILALFFAGTSLSFAQSSEREERKMEVIISNSDKDVSNSFKQLEYSEFSKAVSNQKYLLKVPAKSNFDEAHGEILELYPNAKISELERKEE